VLAWSVSRDSHHVAQNLGNDMIADTLEPWFVSAIMSFPKRKGAVGIRQSVGLPDGLLIDRCQDLSGDSKRCHTT
jgi:hypothetical protein